MLARPGIFFLTETEKEQKGTQKKWSRYLGGGKKPDEQSFFSPLLWAGTPQPDIVWYKDAVPISPVKIPRYRVLVGGSLQINGLLPDDTGMFQCFARNLAGEIQTNSYLAVTSTSVRPSVHPPAWDIFSKKLLLLRPPFPVRRSLSLLYSLIRSSVLFLILFSPPPPPPHHHRHLVYLYISSH